MHAWKYGCMNSQMNILLLNKDNGTSGCIDEHIYEVMYFWWNVECMHA